MLKVKLPNLLDALNEVKTPKTGTFEDKTDLSSKPSHEKVKIEKKAKNTTAFTRSSNRGK